MEWLKIVALSVGAAVAYRTAHDQVTARVCVEYFTVGHPIVVDTEHVRVQIVPPDRSPCFIADAWAHGAAYTVGAMGGLISPS